MSPELTLHEAGARYRIPIRKLAFLVRSGAIEGHLDTGRLLIADSEMRRYRDQPRDVIQKHDASFMSTLGPGLVTGASDDDPSGIGTYSQVGSAYGLGLLWMAAYLFPMIVAVQETTARIGTVTQKGLAQVIGRRFGRRVLYPLVAILVIATTVNLGADIGAMVAALQLLVPMNFLAGVVGLTIAMTALEILVPYHRYAPILKWLTVSLLAYVVTAVVIKPDWWLVLRSSVVPSVQFNVGFLAAAVAVMGTTITPYCFFWQASQETEQTRDEGALGDFRNAVLTQEISTMRKDTFVGMAWSNVVMLFIIVTTAFVLHDHGIINIDSAAKAAMALRPLAGSFASLLFTVGIFGVGLLAVPVMAGASAYAVAELFRFNEGLSKKFKDAKGFYWVIVASMFVGMTLNFIGINPIKALYWAAILNGITAPILMFFIFRIGNDEGIMGRFTSPRWVNIFGWIATALMGAGAIALVAFLVLGAFGGGAPS
jgi:NRAMP (natural resistance-associated macrophage protein)-like metal ion transporter